MRVERGVWQPIVFIASINVVLIMIMLVMATSIMAKPAGVTLNLSPQAVSRADKPTVNIRITAENVIYVDNRVMTLNELRRVLASPQLKAGFITIQADKRSSMGRVLDILNLCQGIVKGQVNVTSLE